MLKERMNKKGQEGVTLTTLLLIVLGIVVVVIIIIGATSGFDFIFGKVKLLPGQSLETAVKSCEVAGSSNLKADYCREFKEIEVDGVTQYVTCTFGVIQNLMEGDKKLVGGCGNVAQNAEKEFCLTDKIKESKWDVTLVNGKSCKAWHNKSYSEARAKTCGDLGGAWNGKTTSGGAPKPCADGVDITGDVTSALDKDTYSGELCCKKSL